jgi:SAM-dependent methyltransferase
MKQTIDNKLGEIKFRKKLVEQQTKEKHYFDDEFNSEGIEKIINERMEETRNKIMQLTKKNILITPYIEIGAERGQRSLVMENDFGAAGAAVDLSFDMLKSCNYYSAKFNQPKIPLRICTDAYNLPFKSNSIPFVFCYQTLHHFPDPTPIIHEAYRVLCEGGVFLFDDEPYKKNLHLDLYKKRNKVYSKEERERSFIGRTLDYFLLKKAATRSIME